MFKLPKPSGLLIALGLLLLPGVAQAADGFVRMTSVMRAGPDLDYPAIGRVYRGDRIRVLGCLRRYTWCDVIANGDRGWLAGNRIEIIYRGRRDDLSLLAPVIGLSILSFAIDDYWDQHYVDRPWFSDHRWRRHRRDHDRPGDPRRPIRSPDVVIENGGDPFYQDKPRYPRHKPGMVYQNGGDDVPFTDTPRRPRRDPGVVYQNGGNDVPFTDKPRRKLNEIPYTAPGDILNDKAGNRHVRQNGPDMNAGGQGGGDGQTDNSRRRRHGKCDPADANCQQPQ